MKKTLTAILLFVFPLLIEGQDLDSIKGVVLDENRIPVERANIVLSTGSSANDSIIDFTFTDKNGFFYFKRKTVVLNLYLIISSLGKKTQQIMINQTSGTNSELLQIILEKKEFELDEVVVIKERLPYSIRNDTVDYNVSSYINSKDASVEDVLKKLPGIIVDEKGDITYKGKEISRILINDMDIFNMNTKIASRNIGAELVDTIQVLENFSKNIILKEFGENKESVINLKLKKGLTSLFSKINAGGGSNDKTDMQVNFYALNRKSGNISIFNHNNIGKTIDKIGASEDEDNDYKMNNLNSFALFSHEPNYTSFRDDLGIFNKLTFGNNNFNYKLKNNQTISGNVQGYMDVNNFSNHQVWEYTFSQNPFSYSFSDNARKDNKFGKIDLSYSNISKKKSDFSSRFIFSLDSRENIFSEEITLDGSQNYLSGGVREKITEFYNSTNYTVTVDSSKAFVLNFRLFSGKHPQNVEFDTNNYFQEKIDSLEYVTAQASDAFTTYYSGTADYLIKYRALKHFLKFSGGVVYLEQNLTTNLADNRIPQTEGIEILSDQHLKLTRCFLEGKYRYSLKEFKMVIDIKPTIFNVARNSLNSKMRKNNKNYFFVEPSFVLTKEFPRNNFLLYYGIEISVPEFHELLPDIYLKSTRQYRKGNKAFLIKDHRILLNYSYFNLFRNTTMFLNLLYNDRTPGIGTKMVVEDQFSYYETIKTSGEKSLFVNAQVDKYLPFIRSKMSVGYNLSYLEFQKQLNEFPRQNYYSTSHSYQFGLKSNFTAFFNFDLSLKYQNSLFTAKTDTEGNSSDIFQGRFGLNFNYKKRILLSPLVSLFKNGYESEVSPIIDISGKYSLLKPKADIELIFRNILNTKRFTQMNISEYSRITMESKIHSFFVMGKVSFYIPNLN